MNFRYSKHCAQLKTGTKITGKIPNIYHWLISLLHIGKNYVPILNWLWNTDRCRW